MSYMKLVRRAAANAAIAAMVLGATAQHLASSAMAQAYPSKPIRIIVTNAPGASTDIIARVVAQSMSEKLGVAVVVDNRAGASGVVGMQAAATAAPDGYTLLFGTQDTLTLLPILKKNLPYDPERDYVPIAKVGDVYLVLACHASVPAQTLGEFIALAKAKPGELNFGSAGIGGINHLAIELFAQRTGTVLTHVPYKGGAPAAAALLAGEVNLFAGSAPLLAEGIRSGRIRGLAFTKDSRSDLLPSVPTTLEAGVQDFVVSAYFGIFAPKAVPAPIVALLSETIVAGASTPEFRQRLAAASGEGRPLGSPEFAGFWKAETQRWRAVIERAQMKIEEY